MRHILGNALQLRQTRLLQGLALIVPVKQVSHILQDPQLGCLDIEDALCLLPRLSDVLGPCLLEVLLHLTHQTLQRTRAPSSSARCTRLTHNAADSPLIVSQQVVVVTVLTVVTFLAAMVAVKDRLAAALLCD